MSARLFGTRVRSSFGSKNRLSAEVVSGEESLKRMDYSLHLRDHSLFTLFCCALFVCVSLVGCSERELVVGLSARERVTAVTILGNYGISVSEERVQSANKDAYVLRVPESDYPLALKIIEQLGLPKDRSSTSAELLGKDSLIPPTPEMISRRLDLVTGQKIKELLEHLPGVVSADVLYRKESTQQVATAVLQYQSGFESPEESAKIIITQAAERGLPLNVDVKSVPLELGSFDAAAVPFSRPFSFKISPSEKERATYQVFSLLGLSSLSSLVVGFFTGLVVSGVMFGRLEKARAARRRTGEYPIMPIKTANTLSAFQSSDFREDEK